MPREPIIIGGAALVVVVALCQWAVRSAGDHRLFDSTERIPMNETGLVLGTSRLLASRRPNPFFVQRIEAAARLYHAGKVKRLILSGRVDADGYSEPEDMRRDLRARDVPGDCLLLDTHGFRTIESIKQARRAFGLTRVTLVSQEFHNRRALFFCQWYGLDAVGLNADSPRWQLSWRTLLRETVARMVAVVDVMSDAVGRLFGRY
jgi:SanA protein